jgi:hemerythrin-like domain-containing protein
MTWQCIPYHESAFFHLTERGRNAALAFPYREIAMQQGEMPSAEQPPGSLRRRARRKSRSFDAAQDRQRPECQSAAIPQENTMARNPRPERIPAPAMPDFEQLDRTHRAALDMLLAFESLLSQLDARGQDNAARNNAQTIIDFFTVTAAGHHAAEEQLVFPPLLASGDDDLIHQIRRLQQDHGWIEEDWLELAPHLEAIATGYNGYDLPMLRAALPVFRTLYQEHIALEESLIYPLAREHQTALDLGQSQRQAQL